jgi:glyoxylase-like metal-dependent hydrolase (beta-lactamase superfamily II)
MPIRIADNLFQIAEFGQGVNAFLWDPRGALGGPIMFDTGLPFQGAHLVHEMVAVGCEPESVRMIVITHDDLDHVGRLASLQAVSGAVVAAHTLEIASIGGNTFRRSVPSGPISRMVGVASLLLGRRFPHQAVHVSLPLEDGDPLPGGWVAIHTPGHTAGHTSYFHPADRVLLAGDALGNSDRGLTPPVPFFTPDHRRATLSIKKLAELNPEVIGFGHGATMVDAASNLRVFAATLEPLSLEVADD